MLSRILLAVFRLLCRERELEYRPESLAGTHAQSKTRRATVRNIEIRHVYSPEMILYKFTGLSSHPILSDVASTPRPPPR